MSEVFKSLSVLLRRSQSVEQDRGPSPYPTQSQNRASLLARGLGRVSILRATKGRESPPEAPRLEENGGLLASVIGTAKVSCEVVTEGH